jgi:hypothetical protein
VELALKSCLLGVRLGQAVGLTAEELRETYYEALLRYVGCNAEAHIVAALFGDEMELRRDLLVIDRSILLARGRVILRAVQRADTDAPLPRLIPGTLRLFASARSATVTLFPQGGPSPPLTGEGLRGSYTLPAD